MRALLAVVAISLGWSAPANAQCQLCPADSAEAPAAIGDNLFPITITVETELDFSRMVIAPALSGTATLDPRHGRRTVTGGLSELGGIPMRGTVNVRGRPLRRVRVTLPSQVQLTTPDGGTALLTDLKTDIPGPPRLGPFGTLEFGFGGTLRVSAGTAGDYRGRIPIDIVYE